MRLENKIAIVTGAGRGIGRAVAMRLAEEGAQVVVSDIEKSFAQSVADRITESGGHALATPLNVIDPDEVDRVFEDVVERFGEIHILVNNAGFRNDIPFHNLTEVQWEQALEIQIKGNFNCVSVVQKYMVRQNYGKIVNSNYWYWRW